MCIAILNSYSTLPDSYIKNSWENNDQGAGLLWVENGNLSSFKTYKYGKFLSKYKELRKNKAVKKIVLHFRIATSGHVKYINLHPFFVSENLGFVHNGVISGMGNETHSDTYQFNELLKGFTHDFLNCPTTLEFIRDYISGSKLIFLDDKNRHTIINEKAGHWDNDKNWFSNNSYKQTNDYWYYGNQKVKKTGKTALSDSWDSWDDWGYYGSASNAVETAVPDYWGTDRDDVKRANIDLANSQYKNADTLTLSKFCRLYDTSLHDEYFRFYLEEAADLYRTSDIRKIVSRIEEEENA